MSWDRILQPDVLCFILPITAIVMVGINRAIAQFHRHRERLAMIEQGMDPDANGAHGEKLS